MQPRIMVCDPSRARRSPMVTTLVDEGYEVERCWSLVELLETVTRERPSAVVATLNANAPIEIQMLRLLRRLVPGVPVVVVTDDGSIAGQRAVRALNPTYLALTPVEPEELVGAIRGALARPRLRWV